MTETLTITDNRTGRSYELPIEDGAIRAPENMIQNVPISNDHIENVNAVCRREKAAREKSGQSPAPAATPAPTPKTP